MVETTANEINRKTTKSDSVKLTTTTITSTTKTVTETTSSEHQPFVVCVIVQTKRIRGLFVYDKVFVLLVLLLFFLILTGLIQSVDGCLKSSIYYRTKVRTRSHVFAPGEYQPRQWEHTAEASGPLDVRDFQHTVPTKRLVRVTSPHILFDSEEARWMTKGCRDRLLKLSTQIQNTWAKQDVILRVLRAWTEPPPQYKQRPASSESGMDMADSNESEAESLLYNHDSIDNGDQTTSRMPKQQTASTYVSASSHRTSGFIRPQSSNNLNSANIIDMTPEMLVDERHPESVEKTPTSRSHPMNIQYDYLSPNPSPSPTSTLKWPSMQSYRPSSAARIYSTRSDQSYIQQSPLRYYSSAMDSNPPVGRSFRSTSSTKMMRLPRHIHQMEQTSSETSITSTIAAITTHTALNPTKSNRKVGRSVYSLPMPLDTGYTSVNTMSQLAFEQWLQMRMEEFHYAGRAVDVQLVPRGGGYIDMRNPEFSLGVLAQIAYYVAQFDWCYLSRSGHVHCSVKPDASITSQWFGCFPGSAELLLDDGSLARMDQIKIGDHVLGQNMITGEMESTPVVAFLHRDVHAWSPMLRVVYTLPESREKQNRSLFLTPDHLVFTKHGTNGPMRTVFSSSLSQGDIIMVSSSYKNKTLREGIVFTTEYAEQVHDDGDFTAELIGLYAPLTQSGSIIVNNVVVSCFAHFSDSHLSYFATWPIQCIYRLTRWFKNPDSHFDVLNGVHWFAELLLDWLSPIIPGTMFHSQT